MRQIGRWMLNGLTVLSLVLCAAAVGLWVRSYRHPLLRSFSFRGQQCQSVFSRGKWTLGNMPQVAMESKRDEGVSNDLRVRIAGLRASIVGDEKDAIFEDSIAKKELMAKKSRLVALRRQFAAIMHAQSAPRTYIIRMGTLVTIFGCVMVPSLVAQWRMRRTRTDASLCRVCRYNLTANISGVCPECGTKIANVG